MRVGLDYIKLKFEVHDFEFLSSIFLTKYIVKYETDKKYISRVCLKQHVRVCVITIQTIVKYC